MQNIVLIKGAGDLATGIAHRLFRSKFSVVMTELPQPTVIRRTVAFAEAIYQGKVTVEGVTALHVTLDALSDFDFSAGIPVLVEPLPEVLSCLKPAVFVDATISKRNCGTAIGDAPVVIGVGPGFTAGQDVHFVVETARGHDLGRVITRGSALPNTGIPGEIGGYTTQRILRAPCEGIFNGLKDIGAIVEAGEIVGNVGDSPVLASIPGVLRGLLHTGLPVTPGMKIGDVDPRCKPEYCFSISDKARAIGGGVLEAIMSSTTRG